MLSHTISYQTIWIRRAAWVAAYHSGDTDGQALALVLVLGSYFFARQSPPKLFDRPAQKYQSI
jgi:hypothetical protein